VRYYIAYKYSNNKNKDDLKSKLEKFSHKLTGWGHSTFVLGRDVKKWKHIHFGSIKLIPVIYSNMKNCDAMVAYVDSPSFSKGLFFEIVISKILRRSSILIKVDGYESKFFKHFFNKTHYISNIDNFSPELLS